MKYNEDVELSLMKEKVVLITGGSKGIGRKTVEEFSKKGYTVILNYRKNDEFVENLISELSRQYTNTIIPIKGDISVPEECERMATEIWSNVESVDILIHNAGPYVKERKSFADYLSGR